MGNSRGSYRTTRENSMAAYDKLHPAVRLALQEAMFCWAPQPIRTALNRNVAPKDMVRSIAKWDADHAAKTRVRYWGKGYPKFTRGV